MGVKTSRTSFYEEIVADITTQITNIMHICHSTTGTTRTPLKTRNCYNGY